MFLHHVALLVLSAILWSGSASGASSKAYASVSCAELTELREATDAATTRLAEWMERHCPGVLEDTDPFCRLQAHALLERLAEFGELKAALDAKGCVSRQLGDAGAQKNVSLTHLAATPPHPVDPPRTIGSFDDNWPWPRRPTFQAGLAATAAFRIRRCLADPECEW